jgi:hypothetical protein
MKWRNGTEVDVMEIKSGLPCGWGGLIDRLFSDLVALGWNDGTVLQVKVKFGGLRFYVASADVLVQQRIDEAEEESLSACLVCGGPGHPSCEEHS